MICLYAICFISFCKESIKPPLYAKIRKKNKEKCKENGRKIRPKQQTYAEHKWVGTKVRNLEVERKWIGEFQNKKTFMDSEKDI